MAPRLVFTMAANRGWKLECLDAKSAFLQGDTLQCLVYIKPPSEYKPKGKGLVYWRLKKGLYGLGDAPRGWYLRVDQELTKLQCYRVELDPALYAYWIDGVLSGLLGVHVDDFIYCGSRQFFTTLVRKLIEVFIVGEPETLKFSYVGWQIEQQDSGEIKVSQELFVKELEELDKTGMKGMNKTDRLSPENQQKFRSVVDQPLLILNFRINHPPPPFFFNAPLPYRLYK